MIKSDKWIKRRSNVRRQALHTPNGAFHSWCVGLPVLTYEQEKEHWHYREVRDPERCMIEPFLDKSVKAVDGIKIISKGVSSYGYDVTLADDLKVFTNNHGGEINPKAIDQKNFFVPEIKHDPEFGRYVSMPPNSYMLGRTVEYFRIPRNVLVICLGKSTYARAGIIVNVTPIEPEWKGVVVLEVANTTALPARVYVDEGLAQFLFLESDEECEVSYEDRGGKYQGQTTLKDATV